MSATPYFQSQDRAPAARRLLVISYHFPPSRAAGALRWQKLTAFAFERGVGVDVIALDPADLGKADQESLTDLPPGTRVFGVRDSLAPWERFESFASKLYGRRRASSPAASGAGGAAAPSGGAAQPTSSSLARHELPRFPRTRQDWRRAYYAWTQYSRERSWARRAASLGAALVDVARHRAVVTCGPPHMAHEAGRRIARRTGLPLVMDLRDPWTDVERLYESIASPVWYAVGGWYESRCVKGAALIVMNTDRARAALAARYPHAADRVITVMNGCDEVFPSQPRAGMPFRVMYAGTVYLDRDPRPLLRAVAAVVQDLHLAPEQLTVDFVGSAGSYGGVAISDLARDAGIGGHVRQVAHVPRHRLFEMMSDAAVLVTLPQDSHMAIPSKIFEYMGFPAWLLAFAEPGSATATLLEGTGADVVPPGDVERTAAALRRQVLAFQAGVRPEPIATSHSQYTRRRQADVFFGALERVLGGGGGPRS